MPRGIPNKPDLVLTHEATTPIDQMKAQGLPLASIVVHRSIQSGFDGSPETGFYVAGNNKKKRANLWYTPNGVLMEQKDHQSGALVYKMIPLANISDTVVL